MKNLRLEDLYRAHIREIYRYLLQMSRNAHVAEELTQETFTRATLHLDKLQRETVRAWLLRTAHHLYIDWWRKERRNRHLSLDDPALPDEGRPETLAERIPQSQYHQPEEAAIQREMRADIWKVMRRLPESYRTVLVLRDLLGLSYAEIASVTCWPLSKVKVLIYRARQRFRQLYLERED